MNIETGKTYKTRDGNSAIVEAEYREEEPLYPFFGRCYDQHGKVDRIAFWMSNGRYSAANQTGFDLVGEGG